MYIHLHQRNCTSLIPLIVPALTALAVINRMHNVIEAKWSYYWPVSTYIRVWMCIKHCPVVYIQYVCALYVVVHVFYWLLPIFWSSKPLAYLHVLVSLLLKLLHYQDVGIHVLLAATKQGVTVAWQYYT